MKLPSWIQKKSRSRLLLTLYCVFMLWLLFGRGVHWQGDYWSQVQNNLNLIPFRTVLLYIHLLQKTQSQYLIQHAVINLVGNVVMFIPLGLLLPSVWPRLKSTLRFFPAVILLICLIELLQLFTLLGSCDVDDLIFNVIGAGIGFIIFRLRGRKTEDRE